MNVLIINGPNLNKLKSRPSSHYGSNTLEEIEQHTMQSLKPYGVFDIVWEQTNLEGEIVNLIQEINGSNYDLLVINPGGYSHTSVAVHDALETLNIPVVEVHLSQIYKREAFRHQMLTARQASRIMTGLGKESYFFAILSEFLKDKK